MYLCCYFFFFNDTATTEIYTLSLHDALPILPNATAHPIGNANAVKADVLFAFLRDRVLPSLAVVGQGRSEEHTSELQSRFDLVCRLLLEKKKKKKTTT